MPLNVPLSGGAAGKKGFPRTRFDSLDDTFEYTGNSGKVVTVRGDETGLTCQTESVIDDRKTLADLTDSTPAFLIDKLEAAIAVRMSLDTTDPLDHKLSVGVDLGTQSDQAAAGDHTHPGLEDHKVLVTLSDSTPDYLEDKLAAGIAISLTTENPSGDEDVKIGVILGTLSDQACAGDDTRLSDSRAPTAHAGSHEGGGDPMTVDAAPASGSLRTLGTLSDQACAGDDTRLSNSRTPIAHAFAGLLHLTDSIASIQSKVSDGFLLTSAAGEINSLSSKGSPTLTDQLVIEDAADGYNKKKVDLQAIKSLFGL